MSPTSTSTTHKLLGNSLRLRRFNPPSQAKLREGCCHSAALASAVSPMLVGVGNSTTFLKNYLAIVIDIQNAHAFDTTVPLL